MGKVQKKVLSGIIGSPDKKQYQKLKIVKFLTLSVYYELHDILLFRSMILNSYGLNKDSSLTKIDGTGIRQENRGRFFSRECRLKKPRENFWSRTVSYINCLVKNFI